MPTVIKDKGDVFSTDEVDRIGGREKVELTKEQALIAKHFDLDLEKTRQTHANRDLEMFRIPPEEVSEILDNKELTAEEKEELKNAIARLTAGQIETGMKMGVGVRDLAEQIIRDQKAEEGQLKAMGIFKPDTTGEDVKKTQNSEFDDDGNRVYRIKANEVLETDEEKKSRLKKQATSTTSPGRPESEEDRIRRVYRGQDYIRAMNRHERGLPVE